MRVFLAALLVGVLCSCGAQTTAQNDTPSENTTIGERTSSGRIASEETTEPAARTVNRHWNFVMKRNPEGWMIADAQMR